VTIIKPDGNILILNEPYIKQPPNYNYTGIVIPANEYFVLGITVIIAKILIPVTWYRAAR